MREQLNILIAESAGFSAEARAHLESVGRVECADLERDALIDRLADVDVLWVRLRNRIDRVVLDAAPRLKVLATPTTGLTHIDVRDLERRGIHLVSLAGESVFLQRIRATAELTLGLALALLRRLPAAVAEVESGRWDRDRFKGREIFEKTVGVLGYGRLGRIVASYFHTLGARVLAHDPYIEEAGSGVEMVTREELLRAADIVSLHMNYTTANRMCFDRDCFASMKHGAWLINTARGELVDEQALLDALMTGQLGGAALDVLQDEQGLAPDACASHPLIEYARNHDNLIVTPHIGGCTYESMENTEVFLAGLVVAWLAE